MILHSAFLPFQSHTPATHRPWSSQLLGPEVNGFLFLVFCVSLCYLCSVLIVFRVLSGGSHAGGPCVCHVSMKMVENGARGDHICGDSQLIVRHSVRIAPGLWSRRTSFLLAVLGSGVPGPPRWHCEHLVPAEPSPAAAPPQAAVPGKCSRGRRLPFPVAAS